MPSIVLSWETPVIMTQRQSYYPGMAYDEALAERLRDRLRGLAGVTEKKMFGGLAFLSHGNMTVGVRGDDLIARINPDDTDAALAQPGVRYFDATARPMRGWIMVAGETLDDVVLDRWVAQAGTFVATLPPK
jgi:TfoX/Sxy family transcriptional regulator of competence genes